ncbi:MULTISPECIES: arylsulfatase [Prauserella salsuginis group]|uniref:Arylsulfatase n=1 Tax=Prauserella salsuginis TaxID=387889 RepID=A0ABW6G1E4_9PSEU|nr:MULTISPECIES: arylsulfatase [Prauserella salsuginis group]MCR3722158.1 arylsulfatase [Prauserella flava]MCR3736156.1 arylsulfatase [Prauserella salsuginis]
MSEQPDPYENFGGSIGRTFRSSQPWWPPRTEPPDNAPNVVVIVVDDLGFSDLGCYGSEIDTPNIDALADSGTRYTNFHVTPLCSPTRAALMTGLNSHAAGMGYVSNADPGFPGYAAELPDNQPTMPEIFRANGYRTFMLGKWHLTKDSELSEAGDRSSWPLQRGFDEYYGFLEAMTNLHQPHRLYDGNSVVDVDRYPEGYYLTDDLTDRAQRMIHGLRASHPHKPFFMYFAHGAVHAPLHAKEADIVKYRDRYAMGWDRLRQQRLARQVDLGIVEPATELPPRNSEPGEDVRAWEELSPDEQRLFARYMEVYAAMVDNVDTSVGRIVDCLRELGELDNTIILVTSDNGASREGNEQGSSHYFRGRSPEPGKTRQEKDFFELDLANFDAIGGPTTWPHYPRGWAMACNTPFRLYKTTTFAGGHQVPLILSWPHRASHPNAIVREQYAHVTDVLPTLVDLIGLDVPRERNGRPAVPWAGSSFAATFDDPDAPTAHNEQYYEVLGGRGYYRDGWEALTYRVPLTPFSDERWQLYHVAEDPTELHDLADDHPALVAELAAAWEDAAWRNGVFPLYEGGGINYLIRPDSEKAFDEPVVLRPGYPTTERYRTSRLLAGRSVRIEVDWRFEHGDRGIVLAHGGQESGYLLYVDDDELRFLVSSCGEEHAVCPVPLPGRSERVTVDLHSPGGGRWDVSLAVDGDLRAHAPGLPQLFSFMPFEGIDVGLDRRSPVCWRLYEREGTFPFTGTLETVTYTPGEHAPDAPEVLLDQARAVGSALE